MTTTITADQAKDMPREIWAFSTGDTDHPEFWAGGCTNSQTYMKQKSVKYIRADLQQKDASGLVSCIKKELEEYRVVAHAKTITDEDKNYWEGRRIGFVIAERILEEQFAAYKGGAK